MEACSIAQLTVEAVVEHPVGAGSVSGLGEAEGFPVGTPEAGSPDGFVKQAGRPLYIRAQSFTFRHLNLSALLFQKSTIKLECTCYPPKRSFGQGNIFTGVCDSVHRGGSGPEGCI